MSYQSAIKNCKLCGDVLELNAKGRPRETCSDACRQALFRREHPHESSVPEASRDVPMRACGYCKTQFPAVNPRKRFCNDKCRIGHWLKRHRKCVHCGKLFEVYHNNR